MSTELYKLLYDSHHTFCVDDDAFNKLYEKFISLFSIIELNYLNTILFIMDKHTDVFATITFPNNKLYELSTIDLWSSYIDKPIKNCYLYVTSRIKDHYCYFTVNYNRDQLNNQYHFSIHSKEKGKEYDETVYTVQELYKKNRGGFKWIIKSYFTQHTKSIQITQKSK